MNGSNLYAFDAGSLKTLYYSNQAAGGRDTLPPLPHFASPIAADGKVFIGTQNSVVIFGLFPTLSPTAGNGQSAAVASTLPVPLTVQALNLYTQNTFPGVTVTFSDGGKGGTFNPPTAVTDSSGSASTSYTLPAKVGSYSLTASATGYPAGLFTETALPATPASLASWSGNNQSAPVTTPLPNPLVLKVKDSLGNGVPGVQVSYTDSGSGGSFSPNPATTNSAGLASVTYTTGTTAAALHGKILASVPGLTSLVFFETVTAGPAANIAATSGNGQSTPPSSQLTQPLIAKVTDQYGNAVSGVAVTFNDGGAGGTFSANPVSTSSTGVASVTYTTSPNAGTVNIQAVAAGVSTPAAFTETVQ
ncbi:MAG: Ig-like domain-containing protein, partial [Candidatus Sulfotelmatobacter sp.]